MFFMTIQERVAQLSSRRFRRIGRSKVQPRTSAHAGFDHHLHGLSLDCGLNRRRCSAMNRSSQLTVTVQDPWYTALGHCRSVHGCWLIAEVPTGGEGG